MLYASIFLLNVMDLILSHYAINVLQVAEELNPIMAPILSSWLIVPVKLGAALLVVLGFMWAEKKARRATRAAAWFVLVVCILVVANNSLVLFWG